jgi:hypothetical protein
MTRAGILVIFGLTLSTAFAASSASRVSRHAEPAVGSEATVATGEPLLSVYEQTEVEFARLKSDALVSQSGMILPKNMLLECDIEQGSGLTECCKGYKAALYCLKDLDHDGKFDKVQIVGGGRPVEHRYVPYETVLQPDTDQPRWKRELVYQGAAAGVLYLTYRQFSADWSRPDVSQDLAYDIAPSGSTDVTYKGAHIIFTSIDGNSAHYKLAAGFAKVGQ